MERGRGLSCSTRMPLIRSSTTRVKSVFEPACGRGGVGNGMGVSVSFWPEVKHDMELGLPWYIRTWYEHACSRNGERQGVSVGFVH